MIKRLLPAIVVFLFLTQPSFGQQRPTREDLQLLRKDVDTIKANQVEIEKAVKEIKELARAGQPAAPPKPESILLGVDDDPLKGDRKARLVLIEFSDFQCPYCARFVRETLPEIERDYIKTGKLKYVFRDFPIASAHKDAFKAALAAGCALDQGKYWEMHDRLFENQSAFTVYNLTQSAESIGLNKETFQQCLNKNEYETEVQSDFADGLKAGVNQTPTFFLGLTEPNSPKVKVLTVIIGAKPYAVFKTAIDSALQQGK
ncbi:MAG TPA: thioredoxin domain-containing protein [Pyrinomonadaceae bacterium]